ncbi:hypothetical protein PBI_WHIRLWIND_42 [Mycobacterium phage Whirlwind]|uniref:Uncharacterized protein n=1 Tax=Mycobacterium phage Whirlwind TaxID=1340826 RepID=S5XYB3_9CAUD|nr:hypothetical protein N852_gp041 [Mycobacterium phage Whirlwind]AGT12649.1 hypothetical protein PBI_WHIRLWIND_42 [Mycobacterium phage Whirlwind]
MTEQPELEYPFHLTLTEPDNDSAKALKDALELLRKDGWGRGKFHDESTGKRDSLGALGAPFGNVRPEAVDYLAYAVRMRDGAPPIPASMDPQRVVIAWNDGFRRKFSEVESVFKAAIRYAEGKGVSVRPGR